MNKLLGLVFLFSFSAHAEFFSGNELLNKMDSQVASERSLALGYIAGINDNQQGINICAPASVTLGQMNDIVHKILVDVPQSRHLSADLFVIGALKAVWPCAEKKKSSV